MINRVAQKFETGNERDIEFARGQFAAERRGMIEIDRPRPAVNQRPGVEIFDAADAQRRALVTRRPARARAASLARICVAGAEMMIIAVALHRDRGRLRE